MNSLNTLIKKAAQNLNEVAQNPEREARLLMAHVLKTSYEDIYIKTEHPITTEEEDHFDKLIQRRQNHEPLSKIRQEREFWSLPFYITKDTLDPRPDSETLIEAVLSSFPVKETPLRILDLGTGTGCLLLSLLHEYPNAWGLGIDISETAILVAQENARRLHLENRANLMVGNWGDALRGTFDVIISNPPYIARNYDLSPEVAEYDPEIALYGGNDGLDCYRELQKQLPKLATSSTKVFLEMGIGQFDALHKIFLHAIDSSVCLDLSHRERCFVFCIKPMPVK